MITNLAYNKFWQKIHHTAKNNNILLRTMFELTYRCNFKCKHCYIPNSYKIKYKGKELKTKEVFLILDQLADTGCFYLGFTGGELFVRRDTIKILQYAKKKGFEIIIYTNGSLIDKSIADALKDIRPNKVDITIPAITKEPFETITRIKGSYEKTFSAIDLLRERKIKLGFKTCLLKENQNEIEKIQKFCRSLGALHRLDTTLSPCLNGSKKPYEYRGTLKNSNIAYHSDITSTEDAGSCNRKESQNISEKNIFWCGSGSNQAAITPSGELKICLMIDSPKYQLLNNNLKKQWTSLREHIKNIKTDKYRCDNCSLFLSSCKWCPAKSWLEHKNFTTCILKRYDNTINPK